MAPDEGMVDTLPVETAGSFMARLRYLFASTRQRNGAAWSLNAVSRASQGRLSPQAIYRLYSGLTTNPSLQTIRTLAEVFGVETDYFVHADGVMRRQAQTQAAFAQIADDPTIAFVSRRMGQMSPEDKALTVDFVRRLTRDTSSRQTRDGQGDARDGADGLPAPSVQASSDEMRHDLVEQHVLEHQLMEHAPAQAPVAPSEAQGAREEGG